MQVALEPKKGWVWVHATVDGPAGRRAAANCSSSRRTASRSGRQLAGVSGGRQKGTRLEGMALIDPADVAAIQVNTEEGQTMVTVPV